MVLVVIVASILALGQKIPQKIPNTNKLLLTLPPIAHFVNSEIGIGDSIRA